MAITLRVMATLVGAALGGFPHGDSRRNDLKLHSPPLITLLALAFAAAMWVLFRTLRLQMDTSVPGTNPYDTSTDERFLYCVWHDSMVIPVFAGRHRRTTALTSHHADGSFVAGVLKLNHIAAIRGSSSRITTGAIRELMQRAETQHIVITPDGPRGPARCMSSGIAFLASRTGRAVVPTAYACSRCWRCRGSWSDLVIPKPFAKVVLIAGAPIHVSSELTKEQIHGQVERIQASMDGLHEAAEAAVQGGDHHPARHQHASEDPCHEGVRTE